MIRINLYTKDKIDMNLLIGSYEKERFNLPFYNTNIELWKGVDNTIEFSIRNHDRKAQILPATSKLVFRAINNKLQQEIEKDLDVVNANLGRYSVTITRDELNDYDNAIFTGHVAVIDKDGHEDLLYSGTDWLPNFDVEVKPNKLELLQESEIIDGKSFTKEVFQCPRNGLQMERLTSSIMKSNVTDYHSFLLKLKDFIGTIKFQGSSIDTPDQTETNWFDIGTVEYTLEDPESGDDSVCPCCEEDEDTDDKKCCEDCCDKCNCHQVIHVEEPFTGNITETYNLNCLWVRVQYIRPYESDAYIEEVYYRN